MEPYLASIIINTAYPTEMLRFYGRLGLKFEKKQISKGGQCHQAFLGPVELTLYEKPALSRPQTPDLQLTLQVKELDEMTKDLSLIEGVQCLLGPTLLPDGKKAILIDPDGRAIELIELITNPGDET